jgi:hypothetical protein
MACCKCCCGNAICEEGDEGKCCCGEACCQEGQYCCDGVCQAEPCDCESAEDCEEGERCCDGVCQAEPCDCVSDEDCEEGENCCGTKCQEEPCECETDQDCQAVICDCPDGYENTGGDCEQICPDGCCPPFVFCADYGTCCLPGDCRDPFDLEAEPPVCRARPMAKLNLPASPARCCDNECLCDNEEGCGPP